MLLPTARPVAPQCSTLRSSHPLGLGSAADLPLHEDWIPGVQLLVSDPASGVSFFEPAPVKVDLDRPTVTITNPIDATSLPHHSRTTLAAFSCAGEPGGSGIKTCAGSAANGGVVDTETLGPRMVTVTAIDNAGNLTVVTRAYTVTPIPVPGAGLRAEFKVRPGSATSDPGDFLPRLDGSALAGMEVEAKPAKKPGAGPSGKVGIEFERGPGASRPRRSRTPRDKRRLDSDRGNWNDQG